MTVPVEKLKMNRMSESIRYIHSLNLKQKERLCDEIYEKQPELLFEALMLHHAGVPAEKNWNKQRSAGNREWETNAAGRREE